MVFYLFHRLGIIACWLKKYNRYGVFFKLLCVMRQMRVTGFVNVLLRGKVYVIWEDI